MKSLGPFKTQLYNIWAYTLLSVINHVSSRLFKKCHHIPASERSQFHQIQICEHFNLVHVFSPYHVLIFQEEKFDSFKIEKQRWPSPSSKNEEKKSSLLLNDPYVAPKSSFYSTLFKNSSSWSLHLKSSLILSNNSGLKITSNAVIARAFAVRKV